MAETNKRKYAEAGPISEQVSRSLAQLRSEQRRTTAQLAAVVTDLGVPMTASTITKIETQGRKVTVDELVAMAAALEVSPVTLMLPREDTGTVRLTERCTASDWRGVWRWMHGESPFFARAAAERRSFSDLAWLAVNRPYVTKEEIATTFMQPGTFSVEWDEGDDDDSDS